MSNQISREIFMAGFRKGAECACEMAARFTKKPLTKWDYRDELLAERAWQKYLAEPDKLHRESRRDKSRKG